MDTDKAVAELLELADGRRKSAIQTLTEVANDPANFPDELGQASLLSGDGANFASLAAFIAASDVESIFALWNDMDTDARETLFHYAPAAHAVIHHYAEEDK